jgi:hypothetical protein
MRLLHPGQVEGGDVMDCLTGTRKITTLRNDPMTRPYTAAAISRRAVMVLASRI